MMIRGLLQLLRARYQYYSVFNNNCISYQYAHTTLFSSLCITTSPNMFVKNVFLFIIDPQVCCSGEKWFHEGNRSRVGGFWKFFRLPRDFNRELRSVRQKIMFLYVTLLDAIAIKYIHFIESSKYFSCSVHQNYPPKQNGYGNSNYKIKLIVTLIYSS